VAAIKPLFESGFANPPLARSLGLDRDFRVRVPPGSNTPALAADLNRFGAFIERAELDGMGGVASTIPDDPDFALQWGMLNTGQEVAGATGTPGADINITPAWDITVGAEDLVLAVLDAGMDEHAEIVGRMIPGRNVTADPDNDDTGDVCWSHGTHVAGIAAATGNNNLGVAGADWSCRIMPVRVLTNCSNNPESWLAEGIVWATDNGADLINMSLQFFQGSSALHDAVLYAHGQGVVMIAAAGNQGATAVAFPARWPETIAVGAIDNRGNRWNLSNRGPNLDVMGPGVSVWSLKGTTQYQFFSGTSMATPHVSGAISLMMSLDWDLTPDQLRQLVQDTAVDMGPVGFDNETGHGRLDAHAAILEAGGAGPGDLNGDGAVGIRDLLILLAAWGPCPDPCPPACSADLDADCTVGIADLVMLLANWG
jgi:subtilisin family serine protease